MPSPGAPPRDAQPDEIDIELLEGLTRTCTMSTYRPMLHVVAGKLRALLTVDP